MKRAGAHSLRSERDLTKFVNLIFMVDPEFDEHAWIREILKSNDDNA